MSTIHDAMGQPAISTQRISSFSRACRDAFAEWRRRGRLRARLYDLSDRELMDIGTTRGEIDYVASNRTGDPRGARST
jgi:uncharacterized protein YjiS (DUF1127 family)